MTGPHVSVVIPAYNNAKVIGETIDSVLAQEGVDLELVIADHTSTDGTRAVIEQYESDSRVTLLDTPAGGGAPRNWNRVTAEATGEFLKLVCGDDVLRPGVLARQAELLHSSGAVFTACRRDIVDADSKVLFQGWGLRGLTKSMPGSAAVRRAVRAGSNQFGEPASVMMRTAALQAAGGWYDRFPYLIDQASYSRVLMTGDFVPDLETGATFRMSATQWSVALVKDQATQAHQFHRWLHEAYPDAVKSADVAMGNVRASLMARARRLSYRVLERRMR
ncbi:glycosyltransferase family 2 protein [Microbacterium maritypicum]|uniref:glycosyltransferase family 2 protein n=1 Tax=Microbacterium maritypicum TaxID=33918 RepID=UPI0037F3B1A4